MVARYKHVILKKNEVCGGENSFS